MTERTSLTPPSARQTAPAAVSTAVWTPPDTRWTVLPTESPIPPDTDSLISPLQIENGTTPKDGPAPLHPSEANLSGRCHHRYRRRCHQTRRHSETWPWWNCLHPAWSANSPPRYRSQW